MSKADAALPPWWERFPGAFIGELEEIRRCGFRPRLATWHEEGEKGQDRLIASGRVRVKAATPGETERWHALNIDVAYPPDYPFDKVDVRPGDPAMRGKRHQLTRSGDICYMQEEVEAWALGYGIERAIEGAKKWFRGVIIGRFDDEVPAAELLSYLEESTKHLRAALVPEHAIWEAPPARYGSLDVEWDRRENGLAVLSVQQKADGPPSADVRSTNDKIGKSLRRRSYTRVRGLWFSLDAEPHPFADIGGLEQALTEHAGISSDQFRLMTGRLLDPVARKRGWLPIGLNYPGRTGIRAGQTGREWLFVCLEWPLLPKHLAKPRRLPKDFWDHYPVLKGINSYSVRLPDLLRRVGDLYPADSASRAHVMVVGTGALGSTVARSLAAAGVQRFTLLDPDIVKPGNIIRHEGRMPDVGKAKVHVVEQILRETNPYVDVEVILGTRGHGSELEQVITDPGHPPTLIIATVALKAIDAQVEDIVRRVNPAIPVLHGWVMAQAQVLRAWVYRADRTACVWCNGLYDSARRTGEENGYIVEPATEDQPFYEASCASPAFPGAGNSNALAAHVITEMALDVLHSRLPDEESHWVLAGNRSHDVDVDFPVAPLTIQRRGFAPHPKCPVCSETVLSTQLSDDEREAYDRELARLRGAA
jgi:hypothetical protein